MSNEDTRRALRKWRKGDLVEAWIGLNDLLRASGVRREKAEARIQQLEEALRFYADRDNNWPTPDSAGRLVSNVALDNGEIARAAVYGKDPDEEEAEGE